MEYIKGCFKYSDEEKELDTYIYNSQITNMIKSYATNIKIMCVLMVVIAIALLAFYYYTEEYKTSSGWIFVKQVSIFGIYFVI